MVGRRPADAAFRSSTPAGPGGAPSRVQLIALLTGLVIIAAGLSVASFTVKPSKARSFDLVYGSLLINDNTSPVAIDLASGKPTVRLNNAFTAVSAKSTADLDVVPLQGGNTLMLNPSTGEFNMVDSTGFVVKTTGGGVRLPKDPDATRSTAIAAGNSAYLLQSGTSDTAIYLVGQLTVASAIGANTPAKARAYATLPTPVDDPGRHAGSANGDLWLLTGRGATHAITQLSVPTGSNAGVALVAKQHGVVSGAAVVASATRNSDGTGGDVAAVASADSVRVYSDGSTTTVPVAVNGLVDDIRAASNAIGQLVFLYHSASSGWNLVTAPVNGDAPAQVTRLVGVARDADLVQPAVSNGHVYTMDTRGSGDLWQIDLNGSARPVLGAAHYPTLSIEHSDLAQSEVMARGSRVIFNARANYEAVVVFSDGSHPPRVINKQSAVVVDPSGATALADAHGAITGTPGKKPGKPTKTPTPPTINDKVDCKTTTQNPHIPTVQLLERGSRSVSLRWSYPLLEPTDCAPSTYTVTTRAVSSDAPSAPSAVTVQGQNSVTLSGLFPDTEYELTVTAYLNKLATASAPLIVRTDSEGPAAPTDISTAADRSGNWTVSWRSCGGVQAGCVPVAAWQIIPRLCDGRGLSSAPAPVQLVGDSTLHTWTWTYRGGDVLLGRGLSFTVEGIGTEGKVGTPTSDHSCVRSWTRPVPTDIAVSASAPVPTIASTDTTKTTVSVRFAKGQIHDLGGVGGQLSYTLLSDGAVVARTGPTTKPTVALSGITAGRKFQVVVRVTPPGHPEAAVTLAAVGVQPAIALWPVPTVVATFDNAGAATGTLTVTVGLNRADTRGETFDLAGSLDCSNAHLALTRTSITPDVAMAFQNVDRSVYNGGCSVSVQLTQTPATATDPPLYGAGPSPRMASPNFTIAAPTDASTAADFTASWLSTAGPDDPQITVAYHGPDLPSFMLNWAMTASNGASNCGAASSPPPTTIHVDKTCVAGATNWTVGVTFGYFGSPSSFTFDVQGSAPAPVDPNKISFTGAWNPDPAATQVIVQYSGPYDRPTLNTLNWTETVKSNGVECGTSTAVPSPAGDGPAVPVDLAACPPTTVNLDPGLPPTVNTYTLIVHYDDPNFGGSQSYTFDIPGSPPQ